MLKHKLGISLLLTTGLTLGALFFVSSPVSAATLTVNSADDTTANDGVCTLREAIIATNNDTASGAAAGECIAGSGTDTINFNIVTGGATFPNNSQTGYTISPTTNLPDITSSVVINGYTQPGSQANTNPAPQSLNGILLIEIDGSSIGTDNNAFDIQADNVEIRGLIVSGFDESAAFGIGGNDLEIQGNYIGTNYLGTAQAATQLEFGVSRNGVPGPVSNLLVGGLDPEDRNLLGGIKESAITPNGNSHNWTIQGNYIGVDITGLSAIPNVTDSTAGALSLDNSNGHIVGGSEPTAINVISGNHGKGIAPNGTSDTRVEGNYIGVGRDGTTPVPNEAGGISYSGGNSDIAIIDNVVSYNEDIGIYLADDPLNAVVQGNKIMNNLYAGVFITNASDVLVGGSSETVRNIISGNGSNIATMDNVNLIGLGGTVSDITIQGNYIGTDENGNMDAAFSDQNKGIGIALSVEDILIGGDQPEEGNLIANSNGPGIKIQEGYAPGAGPLTITPTNIAMIGNSIFDSNEGDLDGVGVSGLGIDLYRVVVDNSLVPVSLENAGPTPNDAADSDTGPNAYINFPVLNSATQDGTSVTVNLDLDAANTTDPDGNYRVELFANDEADPSGYGEGQTFLGTAEVANGNGQDITFTVPNGTDLTGKVLSATTTAYAATDSGYGATSEFSLAQDNVTVISPATDGSGDGDTLADTGWNVMALSLLAGGLVASSLYVVVFRRLRYYLDRY